MEFIADEIQSLTQYWLTQMKNMIYEHKNMSSKSRSHGSLERRPSIPSFPSDFGINLDQSNRIPSQYLLTDVDTTKRNLLYHQNRDNASQFEPLNSANRVVMVKSTSVGKTPNGFLKICKLKNGQETARTKKSQSSDHVKHMRQLNKIFSIQEGKHGSEEIAKLLAAGPELQQSSPGQQIVL